MGLMVYYPVTEAGKRMWLEINLGHGVPGYALGWFAEKEIQKRLEMWLKEGGTPSGKLRTHPLWGDVEAFRSFALVLGQGNGMGTSELYSLARRLARERGAELKSSAPPVLHRP